jgi:hypothetical protein
MGKKNRNKIGFKVPDSKKGKAKSGKGTEKGDTLGFKGGKTKTTYSVANQIERPKDTKRFDKLSMVFFDNGVLNKITEMCLPKAGGSEFQVHYRALVVHIEKDGFEVMLTIPTAYYNFEQEVSSGSVDYDLDDIDNEAEKVKESSDTNVSMILSKLPFFSALNGAGYNVTFKEGNFGSIHRHPGRFGFSSIDLGKNPEFPGVIYRQKATKDFIQTDSVMYISGKECEIYTTEARIVNVEPSPDGGVKGDYCQIPTISIVRPVDVTEKPVDLPSKVLGEIDDDIFSRFHFVGAFGAEVKKYPMLEIILEMLAELEYDVCIDNVDASRISQKTFAYNNGKKWGNANSSKKTYGNGYDSWGAYGEDYYDAWGYDYGYDGLYDYSHGYGNEYNKSSTKGRYDEIEVNTEADVEIALDTLFSYHDVNATDKELRDAAIVLMKNFTAKERGEIISYGLDFTMEDEPVSTYVY